MVDFAKTAFIFPGQGSQVAGMGKDVIAAYPTAKATFDEADDLIGFSLSEIILDNPDNKLNDTMYTQPGIYVYSVALLRVLQEAMPNAIPQSTAGHSLGEFTALTTAEAISFQDAVPLVYERGRLMKFAGEKHPGSMAAILGLSVEDTLQLCAEASNKPDEVVVIANDNCPGQVVISGDKNALQRAVELAKEKGAKRVLPLAVSVATHSPLMLPAAREFDTYLSKATLKEPKLKIYGNVSAEPLTSIEGIRDELDAQLTSTVRWTETIQSMIADGIETFIEIGPKTVLTGLLRRIDRDKMRVNIHDLSSLETFIEANK